MEEKIEAMTRQLAAKALQANVDRMAVQRPFFRREWGSRHRGSKARTLTGLNGSVTARRARFRCSVDGTFYYTLDDVLDLPPGEVTVSLARRALRLCTHMGFSDLQEELFDQHDARLSDTVAHRLMRQVGGVAERNRKGVVEALLPEGVAREKYASSKPVIARPKRVYLSCDGVMYVTRYRQTEGGRNRIVYQEMKCGTVFCRRGTARGTSG